MNRVIPLVHSIRAICERAVPLREPKDLGPLIDRIGGARVVMLGEATHGTHEFYEWRRMISEWLIVKHGFRFIAVEGDWPSCQSLNRYIQPDYHPTFPPAESARRAIESFHRWPTWMWANAEVVRLAEWMRSHNTHPEPERRIGFHGLDLYSFFESISETLRILDRINPFLGRRVRARYACFDRFQENEKAYVRSLVADPEGCEREVIETLQEVISLRINGFHDRQDALFDAQQNARIVRNGVRYYRAMIHGDEDSWNIRDRHMIESLDNLLAKYGEHSKAIVWAHNTHIGDHRATDMAASGLVNIGGLAREKWGERNVALVGFGTYQGSVVASHAWDGPTEKMSVPPARAGSHDEAFHLAAEALRAPDLAMIFDPGDRDERSPFSEAHGQRAIGVVYDPRFERVSNYVPTRLAHRYDAFVFLDRTKAVEPLVQGFNEKDLPETWPMGQ